MTCVINHVSSPYDHNDKNCGGGENIVSLYRTMRVDQETADNNSNFIEKLSLRVRDSSAEQSFEASFSLQISFFIQTMCQFNYVELILFDKNYLNRNLKCFQAMC